MSGPLQILTHALRDSRQAVFFYDGKPRLVEVHAIGTSTKDGSLVMRGYLLHDARPWRLFSLDKIEAVLIGGKSEAPRDGYKEGDAQMNTIIAQL